MSGVRWLGVLSDTHGLWRPEIRILLHGCELIVHAGNVGDIQILEHIRRIAPVVAVRGNVDTQGECATLPLSARFQLGPIRGLLLHNIQDLQSPPSDTNLIVFGHSHQPHYRIEASLDYLNPGSVGRRRFRLPVTLARVEIQPNDSFEVILLDVISGTKIPFPGV